MKDDNKKENNVFIVGRGKNIPLFKHQREGEYDLRLIFDKNFVSLTFENETENGVELVVKVKPAE